MFGSHRKFRVLFEPDPLRLLKNGDDLICRDGQGFSRKIIEIAGNGFYHHTAKFYWRKERLRRDPMVVEMHEVHGGRTIPWEEWIQGRDDIVDVFRPDPFSNRRYDREGTVAWMLENILNKPYDWASIKRFGLQNNWITGWWNRPNRDMDAPCPTDWVCSTSSAAAHKYGGGVHPVHGLWVGDVQPTTLAQANINEYLLTIPSKAERAKLTAQGALS